MLFVRCSLLLSIIFFFQIFISSDTHHRIRCECRLTPDAVTVATLPLSLSSVTLCDCDCCCCCCWYFELFELHCADLHLIHRYAVVLLTDLQCAVHSDDGHNIPCHTSLSYYHTDIINTWICLISKSVSICRRYSEDYRSHWSNLWRQIVVLLTCGHLRICALNTDSDWNDASIHYNDDDDVSINSSRKIRLMLIVLILLSISIHWRSIDSSKIVWWTIDEKIIQNPWYNNRWRQIFSLASYHLLIDASRPQLIDFKVVKIK